MKPDHFPGRRERQPRNSLATWTKRLVRLPVQDLDAYVPGEQPKITGLIKLNTNENPYPPSPKVLAAIRKATDARLRLYPDPSASRLREALGRLHRCAPENVIVGNGSDELLALATRAFVDPAQPNTRRHPGPATISRSTIQYFEPSYSLYPVLADIHGATKSSCPLEADFSLPTLTRLRRSLPWDFAAALTFITTPNAPSGRGYSTADLETLCQAQRGVVVLDEAYVDFADEHAVPLAFKYPQVIVARTFSKAYSLCFQRIGYMIGSRELVAALDKIRDSYNVNGLGQIAALSTLENLAYYRKRHHRIKDSRQRLGDELEGLGFEVFPSQANFLLTRPPRFPAQMWLNRLREQRVLVRWFNQPSVRDFLRITIGSEAQISTLVRTVKEILS